MMTFTDRLPAEGKENRFKLTKSDGTVEYVKLERADEANPAGTPLNKLTFENMQKGIINDMIKTGYYTGDGQNEQLINLGFNPRAVFVLKSENGGNNPIMAFAMDSILVKTEYITKTDNGFKVFGNTGLNTNNTVYNYIAFR